VHGLAGDAGLSLGEFRGGVARRRCWCNRFIARTPSPFRTSHHHTGGGNTLLETSTEIPAHRPAVQFRLSMAFRRYLRTATRENFSSLYQDRSMSLKLLYGSRRTRSKIPPPRIHGCHVQPLLTATSILKSRSSFLDTPLHSFIPRPARRITTHPNAVIALAAFGNCGGAHAPKIYGDSIAYTPSLASSRFLNSDCHANHRQGKTLQGARPHMGSTD